MLTIAKKAYQYLRQSQLSKSFKFQRPKTSDKFLKNPQVAEVVNNIDRSQKCMVALDNAKTY